MPQSDYGTLGLGDELVLSSLGAMASGDAAQRLATLVEEGMRMFGEERFLRLRDREIVASEDELAPEANAQCKDITFSNDDAVQVSLLVDMAINMTL